MVTCKYLSIPLPSKHIDIYSSYLGLLVNLQRTRPMPTLSTIGIDSLEKPCLGNATQQVGRWRGGGTALLHLVLEEGSVAGHSQTRSVVEWIEPAWSRQASALNFRWMTCFPLPSHDVVDEPQLSGSLFLCLCVKEKRKIKKKSDSWSMDREPDISHSVSTSYIHPLTRASHAQKAVTACKPPPNFPLSAPMRRAGVESQILFALFPVRYVHSSTRTKMLLVASKNTHRKTRSHLPNSGSTPNVHLRCAANPARPGSISDGQHIKHMLRGPNQRPQFALSQRQSARFVVRDAPRPLRFRPETLVNPS